ncbi:conserved hypothetical protein [Bosea sp. 62]|nr:conserved hypothetical protein [Bosea sp. 7B]CAD5274886.1 conserved hypothetical protein [Bosea sp. 21B]CAD5276045.1 conserved hypothetical protein [Bosea sp. 46]VVT60050.1 conserved hypothetical protein [Bosea sp. EC-HK365B]VXB53194.1 conserved hypothetical protein [Bosea sp. 62]VXC15376.1 conserved hypothetical protein [Bosea sp. 127]VXC16471.1 conserved hypothetical protein [Bosea sp. 29B]VXC70665.1 conserved hypothetical protein [Bosea sp. 125]
MEARLIGPVLLRCDGRQFGDLGNLYAAAGQRAPIAIRRAVKRKGEKARGLMTRAVRDMLGVKLREVRRKIRGGMEGPASYGIVARGTINLKEFPTFQTYKGIKVGVVPNDWVQGEEHLPIAFQGKTGRPSSQPGNAAKRRGTLNGRIVYGVGKGRRQGFRSVAGVMVPMAFIDRRSQAEFNRVAAELPAEMAHQLWVVVEGLDVKSMAQRAARGHYMRALRAGRSR